MTAPSTSVVEQLPDEFVQSYARKIVPFGPVGYIVYKRTYARDIPSQNRTEEWFETCARCINAVLRIVKGALTLEEAKRLYDYMFHLKGCVSGRALWQLGSKTVDRLGGASLVNCWYSSFRDPKSFEFLFDMLMLGGGMGFNTQRENIYQLPSIKHNITVTRQDTDDADFIVPDSREGWIELLGRVIDGFMHKGKSFTYSTKCIRGKGAKISSFGGTASGPEDLVEGIEKICSILSARHEKRLRSIDVLDINNIIGAIVVSGNVRRSAELAMGDPDDFNFLRAKRWGNGNIPTHRAMSNNTIIANKFEHIPDEFWLGYQPQEGEPYGLFNRDLSRKKGRLKDNHRKDPKVEGTNPCAEITLEDWEACNLTEIFLPNIVSAEEFKEVSTLLQKVAKLITTLPYHWPKSEEVIKRNRRIGGSITGVTQADDALLSEKTLDYVYKAGEEHDKKFSAHLSTLLGYTIKESIKLTTIKPSGTLSLLAGVSPGCHPEYAPYYIRRVRIAANDPLVTACRNAGYKVEPVINQDGSRNHDTQVVEFLIKARRPDRVASKFTAIDQLELVKYLQTHWSDNSVSCTVYYKIEELPSIKAWLKANYENSIKSVSFLLHSSHGFIQAPLEEITEEEYLKRTQKLTPLNLNKDKAADLPDSFECTTGACPVK